MFIVFGSMGGSGWELIASLFTSHCAEPIEKQMNNIRSYQQYFLFNACDRTTPAAGAVPPPLH
jgi:hypothetical protein